MSYFFRHIQCVFICLVFILFLFRCSFIVSGCLSGRRCCHTCAMRRCDCLSAYGVCMSRLFAVVLLCYNFCWLTNKTGQSYVESINKTCLNRLFTRGFVFDYEIFNFWISFPLSQIKITKLYAFTKAEKIQFNGIYFKMNFISNESSLIILSHRLNLMNIFIVQTNQPKKFQQNQFEW